MVYNGSAPIPSSYLCSITQQVMENPYMDNDGNTYEFDAIREWLENNSTSPLTRLPLQIGDLRPNRNLKQSIQEWITEQQGQDGTSQQENQQPNTATTNAEKVSKIPPVVPKSNFIEVLSAVGRNDSKLKEMEVLIKVKAAKATEATPVDLVVAIDISGSMGCAAEMKDENGNSESYGFNILDTVKHAVRTIISSLTSVDRLALVCFDTYAEVLKPLTSMNDAGKRSLLNALDALVPKCQTNMWGGLKKSLELLQETVGENKNYLRHSSVMILTDGLPNVVPPRGHIAMLQKYRNEHGGILPTINTFGFGYSLDSPLLQELAIEGDGMFSFIPDSSFVGTAFINSVSTIRSTLPYDNLKLQIEALNNYTIVEDSCRGLYKSSISKENTLDIYIGGLQYDQTKHFMIKLRIPDKVKSPKSGSDELTPYLKMTLKDNNNYYQIYTEAVGKQIRSVDTEISIQSFRLNIIESLQTLNKETFKDFEKSKKIINDIMKTLPVAIAKSKTEQYAQNLITDLTGQVSEAISKDSFYSRWGKHYLYSLVRAHSLEVCHNFKDPGVQLYAGELFTKLRDISDEIFSTLPAPKPSIQRRRGAPVVTNMSYFNRSSNPCFNGCSSVQMFNKEYKLVKDIKRGDALMSGQGQKAIVNCVVKTEIGKKTDLVMFESGLEITPYHPILVNNEWKFPLDVQPAKSVYCEAVYSFILDTNHTCVINDVVCCTLGHGFTDNAVIQHDYYGTQLVIHDVMRMRGYEDGLVTLREGCQIKSMATQKVIALYQHPAVITTVPTNIVNHNASALSFL